MDSCSKIHKNASSGDDVMLSFNKLSLNEVLTNEALCLQKCIATKGCHQNLQPDLISNKTSKTKASVNMLNEMASPTQDCALTILDDSCCPDANSNSFLNSTYVVPDDTASSARDSINAKIDFVLRRNSRSNSHQQPTSSDCVITLYESSDSDTSINDSESSLLHSESAGRLACCNENELSYTIKRTSLSSEGETTEEYSNESEDSSDSHQDSDDISNDSEDSSDSDSDSDSVSINDDSDEEPNPSNNEESEDSDDDSSTTSEDKPDSDDESEQNGDESSDESDDSSDDDKSVDLDEASESSSESSEESD